MSPEGRAVCFFIAFVLLIVEAFGPYYHERGWPRFGWFGLAAFVLPFLWDAMKEA